MRGDASCRKVASGCSSGAGGLRACREGAGSSRAVPMAKMLLKGCRSLQRAKPATISVVTAKAGSLQSKLGAQGRTAGPESRRSRAGTRLVPKCAAWPGSILHKGHRGTNAPAVRHITGGSSREDKWLKPAPCLQLGFIWRAGTLLQPAREAGCAGAAQAAPQDQGSSYLQRGEEPRCQQSRGSRAQPAPSACKRNRFPDRFTHPHEIPSKQKKGKTVLITGF